MTAYISVKTAWIPKKALEFAVAEAVADCAPARAVAVRTAKNVATIARRNLSNGRSTSRSKKKNRSRTKSGKAGGNEAFLPGLETYRDAVVKEIHYKDIQVRKRRSIAPGSDIPVALTVADHWASGAFEYGVGPDVPMARYMAAAARAAAGGPVSLRYAK